MTTQQQDSSCHDLDTDAWQIQEIYLALQEADRGDFASDDDVTKVVKKYAG